MKPVEEVEIFRQEQFETFVKEKFSKEKTKNMHDPVKKNKLALFRSPRQKEPSNEKQQISTFKSDCALFSQLGRFFFNIRTVDTDVVIICIGMTQKLNINELWIIAFGTGTSSRYLAVHEIASRLGPEKARSLPVFHAFTGCDTASCFSGKGKKTAWITWVAYEEAI